MLNRCILARGGEKSCASPPTGGRRAALTAPRANARIARRCLRPDTRGGGMGSAGRWQEALEAGCAPRVYLEGCHESVLAYGISLDDLKAHAVPPSSPA